MKKYIICIIVILFAITPVFAGSGWNVGAIGGYSIVNMSNLNYNIDQALIKAENDPNVTYASSEHVNDAWFIGVDGNYTLMPGLTIGPRLEYLSTFSSQMRMNTTGLPLTLTAATADVTASILPVMAGVSYMYTVPWFPLSIGAEVYGGFGFAGLNIETTMQYYFAATTVESFGGSCFVLDSAVKLSYAFNPLFSAGLNIGYFAATASKLKNDKIGLTMPNLTDYSKDLELDFTGLKYEVSLNFSF